MANLTITVDDEILRRVRIRALQQHTSVSALLRAFLQDYLEQSTRDSALNEFLDLARGGAAGSGPGGRTWTRDDAHERETSR